MDGGDAGDGEEGAEDGGEEGEVGGKGEGFGGVEGSAECAEAGRNDASSDVDKATGLEDLFAGPNFGISDRPVLDDDSTRQGTRVSQLQVALAISASVALAAIAWNVPAIRKTACLWLVARLEDLGI